MNTEYLGWACIAFYIIIDITKHIITIGFKMLEKLYDKKEK